MEQGKPVCATRADALQRLAEVIGEHIVEVKQPDAWVCECVLQGIGAVAARMHTLACVLAEKARIPQNQRVTPVWDEPLPTAPQLLRALDEIAQHKAALY